MIEVLTWQVDGEEHSCTWNQEIKAWTGDFYFDSIIGLAGRQIGLLGRRPLSKGTFTFTLDETMGGYVAIYTDVTALIPKIEIEVVLGESSNEAHGYLNKENYYGSYYII